MFKPGAVTKKKQKPSVPWLYVLTRVAKLEMRVMAEKSAMSAISRVRSSDCNRSAQNLEGDRVTDKGLKRGNLSTWGKDLVHISFKYTCIVNPSVGAMQIMIFLPRWGVWYQYGNVLDFKMRCRRQTTCHKINTQTTTSLNLAGASDCLQPARRSIQLSEKSWVKEQETERVYDCRCRWSTWEACGRCRLCRRCLWETAGCSPGWHAGPSDGTSGTPGIVSGNQQSAQLCE